MKNLSTTDVINEHSIMMVIAEVAGIDQRDMIAQIAPDSNLQVDLEIDMEVKAPTIRAKLNKLYPEFQVSPEIIQTCSTVKELIGLVRDEVELG